MKNVIIFISIFLIGCVPKNEYNNTLAEIEKLKTEITNFIETQTRQVLEETLLAEKERQNAYYVTVLQTLANIMRTYDDLKPEARRDYFDYILLSVLENEPLMLEISSVWKSNALDGMDAKYIGRPGSTATGQYAATFSRKTGEITLRASQELFDSIAFLYSYPVKEKIENSIQKSNWKDPVTVVTVPVINPRTNEAMGTVSGIFKEQ